MKKNRKIIVALILGVLLIGIALPASMEISPTANPIFSQASVVLASDMYATFDATLAQPCPSISVTACTLQRLVSGQWVNAGTLTPPAHIAYNTSWYDSTANYSSFCTKGQTYRIKAVFSAGGESVTRYSPGATYK